MSEAQNTEMCGEKIPIVYGRTRLTVNGREIVLGQSLDGTWYQFVDCDPRPLTIAERDEIAEWIDAHGGGWNLA